jgi:hypothetical protein
MTKKNKQEKTDEEEFTVEKILEFRRGKGGRKEYLIKWLGYSE